MGVGGGGGDGLFGLHPLFLESMCLCGIVKEVSRFGKFTNFQLITSSNLPLHTKSRFFVHMERHSLDLIYIDCNRNISRLAG